MSSRTDINPANGDIPHVATQATIHRAWTSVRQSETQNGVRRRRRSAAVVAMDAEARRERARALEALKHRRDNAKIYRALARHARLGDPARIIPPHVPLKLARKTTFWRLAAEAVAHNNRASVILSPGELDSRD